MAVLRASWREWTSEDATRLAAAVTFYAVFSIAPMLLLLVSVAGTIFG